MVKTKEHKCTAEFKAEKTEVCSYDNMQTKSLKFVEEVGKSQDPGEGKQDRLLPCLAYRGNQASGQSIPG